MHARAETRERAACELVAMLDEGLFRALCEPARLEILRVLLARGRSDLAAVAERVPQDASGVSRHLAVLQAAGFVRREREGRHVFYEIDGPAVLARFESIVAGLRRQVPICCPGRGGGR